MEKGEHLSNKNFHYEKVKAFVLSPSTTKGHMMLDGEALSVEPFSLEVHKGLANLFIPPHWEKEKQDKLK